MERGKQGIHHEDLALKTAAQYFGEELLPFMGITGAVALAAPTETVKLEARKMYQDFNYVMEEGHWIHLEFESDFITLEDLRRFREYEASTSRAHKVAVVTYVICSSRVSEPVTELVEGINVYRVGVVQMKGQDGDQLFARLEEKREKGERPGKADLVPLLLTPLMSSRLGVKERIAKSLELLREEAAAVTKLEMEKMQAVLYTFADKFLTARELEQIKEMIAMTRLGQMLVEDGIARGIEQGIEQGIALTKRVIRLSKKGCTPDQIARDCGIGLQEVNDILREDEDL
ncbi:MAG: hypothetical protein LUH04_06520 [Clostridium sp.]|nr:hypothetical protein [Clostridium sp.]